MFLKKEPQGIVPAISVVDLVTISFERVVLTLAFLAVL